MQMVITSDQININTKIVTKNYIIRVSIYQKELSIINIYGPNIWEPKYMRQSLTEVQGEIYTNTIIVGDFNTPVSITEEIQTEDQ